MNSESETRLRDDVAACRFVTTAVHYYGSDKDQLANDIEAALDEIGRLRTLLARQLTDELIRINSVPPESLAKAAYEAYHSPKAPPSHWDLQSSETQATFRDVAHAVRQLLFHA